MMAKISMMIEFNHPITKQTIEVILNVQSINMDVIGMVSPYGGIRMSMILRKT